MPAGPLDFMAVLAGELAGFFVYRRISQSALTSRLRPRTRSIIG